MSGSGIKGLFNKKKNKGVERAAKAAAKEQQDDGEWLASAPTKAPVRVVTSGKVADDYCPEIVEEVVIDARTQMEIDETKKMLLEVKMRQQEASEQPKPPASSVGVGLDAIDWRAKAGERRLKEMEKNKETEFPALAADRPLRSGADITSTPVAQNITETNFTAVSINQHTSLREEHQIVEPSFAGSSGDLSDPKEMEKLVVSEIPIDQDQSTTSKKPKKKKGSYIDF